jgi:hypothetical protein
MRAILVALCALFSFCALAASNGWIGKSVHDLQAKMGSPIVTNVQPNGNVTYTYVTRSVSDYSRPVNPNIATIALPHGGAIGVNAPNIPTNPSSTLINCTVTFEANPQGIIVDVRKRGGGC